MTLNLQGEYSPCASPEPRSAQPRPPALERVEDEEAGFMDPHDSLPQLPDLPYQPSEPRPTRRRNQRARPRFENNSFQDNDSAARLRALVQPNSYGLNQDRSELDYPGYMNKKKRRVQVGEVLFHGSSSSADEAGTIPLRKILSANHRLMSYGFFTSA